jgi:hypothetical protein
MSDPATTLSYVHSWRTVCILSSRADAVLCRYAWNLWNVWNDWNDLFLFYFDRKFEIKTTVHKQAEWREKSRGGAVSRKVMK